MKITCFQKCFQTTAALFNTTTKCIGIDQLEKVGQHKTERQTAHTKRNHGRKTETVRDVKECKMVKITLCNIINSHVKLAKV